MPSHLGFDANTANSCYQTASFVALFLFPSPPIKRILQRRTPTLRGRTQAENQARKFLLEEIDLAGREQKLSVEQFLRIRTFLKDVPYARMFSNSQPNDVAEWTEAMLQILGFKALLHFSSPNHGEISIHSLILNLPILRNQHVQSALNSLLEETPFSAKPVLLPLNLQRPIRKTRLGNILSSRDVVKIDPEIRIEIVGEEYVYQLTSVVVMNPDRNHYSAYVKRPEDGKWFFLSDINGLCQQLADNFDSEFSQSMSRKHQSLRRNAHLLIYVPQE